MFTFANSYSTLIWSSIKSGKLSVTFALFMHEVFSITTKITSKLWHKYVNNNEQQQTLESA